MVSGAETSARSADEGRAALLGLGRWFVDRAGLDVRIAGGEEVAAALALRRGHVERAGWQPGPRSTADHELDGDDDRAVHLTAWDGAVLAGTARLVFPTPGRPLPTEALFGLVLEPRGRVVDGGRWLVAPAYRDDAHRVSMGLSGLACIEVVTRGFTIWAGAATTTVIELWRGLGFAMQVISGPRRVLGVPRVAVRCDLLASVPRLLEVLGPLGAPVPTRLEP